MNLPIKPILIFLIWNDLETRNRRKTYDYETVTFQIVRTLGFEMQFQIDAFMIHVIWIGNNTELQQKVHDSH